MKTSLTHQYLDLKYECLGLRDSVAQNAHGTHASHGVMVHMPVMGSWYTCQSWGHGTHASHGVMVHMPVMGSWYTCQSWGHDTHASHGVVKTNLEERTTTACLYKQTPSTGIVVKISWFMNSRKSC